MSTYVYVNMFKQSICYDMLVLFAKIDKRFPSFVVATMDLRLPTTLGS